MLAHRQGRDHQAKAHASAAEERNSLIDFKSMSRAKKQMCLCGCVAWCVGLVLFILQIVLFLAKEECVLAPVETYCTDPAQHALSSDVTPAVR
jgi:hypothetical protein